MKGKIFTQKEAQEMLPLVRRIVTDIKACSTLIDRHARACYALRREEEGQDKSRAERDQEINEHEEKIGKLRERRVLCRVELEDLGIFLEGARSGSVKLYGELEGHAIVYFAWQLGEATISQWYRTAEKFADRRPIDGSCIAEFGA